MPSVARLMNALLALLFVTAMATVDVRPQISGVTAPVQTSFAAELEDGPEGEEAPIAVFVRSSDGDDQIGHHSIYLPIAGVIYRRIAADRGHDPVDPNHPPYAGFPTGPPAA